MAFVETRSLGSRSEKACELYYIVNICDCGSDDESIQARETKLEMEDSEEGSFI